MATLRDGKCEATIATDVADLNGDGKADLVVFNANDWTPVYLGRMISTGAGLQCDWSADWIGGWHLGNVDSFAPCNYQGGGGPEGKHRFIQVPAFDFFVRIPKAHVSDANFPKLTIVLHNVRQAPDRLVPATALQRQSGIETTEVARLSGLSLEKLPPAVRPLFEKALQDNKPPQQ